MFVPRRCLKGIHIAYFRVILRVNIELILILVVGYEFHFTFLALNLERLCAVPIVFQLNRFVRLVLDFISFASLFIIRKFQHRLPE